MARATRPAGASGAWTVIGNAEYPDKRRAYAESAYRTTQNVAEQHAEWSPDRIESRQAALARVATGVWRIAQLG